MSDEFQEFMDGLRKAGKVPAKAKAPLPASSPQVPAVPEPTASDPARLQSRPVPVAKSARSADYPIHPASSFTCEKCNTGKMYPKKVRRWPPPFCTWGWISAAATTLAFFAFVHALAGAQTDPTAKGFEAVEAQGGALIQNFLARIYGATTVFHAFVTWGLLCNKHVWHCPQCGHQFERHLSE